MFYYTQTSTNLIDLILLFVKLHITYNYFLDQTFLIEILFYVKLKRTKYTLRNFSCLFEEKIKENIKRKFDV